MIQCLLNRVFYMQLIMFFTDQLFPVNDIAEFVLRYNRKSIIYFNIVDCKSIVILIDSIIKQFVST